APWFYRIVTNTARQQRRYARHRREVSLDALSLDDATEQQLAATMGSSHAYRADPAEYAECAETRTSLLNALSTPPLKQPTAGAPAPHTRGEGVGLRYCVGYPDQEVAGILGCRLGTVHQRLQAGRPSLKQAIRRRYPWLLSSLSTLPTSES